MSSQHPIRIALIGLGKIAHDQHIPVIAASADYELLAVASRNATLDGFKHFKDIDELLTNGPEFDAVALCMPPQYRFKPALTALSASKHVLLEKPPGATLSEVHVLEERAAENGVSLFASWHSQHAAAVETCRRRLADCQIKEVRMQWKEDVRKWHPDQEWIWQAGGLGVFDPGMNGFSILSRILEQRLIVEKAKFYTPSNKQTPIAVEMRARMANDVAIKIELDWRPVAEECWQIDIDTDQALLSLRDGGESLLIDGIKSELPYSATEYTNVYKRFAELIKEQQSEVDLQPMHLVADAFLLARRYPA